VIAHGKSRDQQPAGAIVSSAFEKFFTPAELAEIWRLDVSTVRRLFEDQAGVLKIGRSKRRDGKRDYVTLRIPESLAERFYRERSR
jgi:hypothetical protein